MWKKRYHLGHLLLVSFLTIIVYGIIQYSDPWSPKSIVQILYVVITVLMSLGWIPIDKLRKKKSKDKGG